MLSFTDFKLSLGITTDENDTEYASILKSLITELYSCYGIALEQQTITKTIYTYEDTSFYIDINPCTLTSVTYNGDTLTQDTDYYWYDRTFELASVNTNTRIPYILSLDIGYDEIPLDLKRAFYELASIRFEIIYNKTYLVDKVNNTSNGTTITYSKDYIPEHLKEVFMEYTGRRFVI